ncbi:MAG TPA: tetratricopeptide repeat protein [Cyclobacteriaceae bacterium]|nr:tetratricopeptide repeat protein [Cyclobacteriaceae bacterium]
MVRALLVLVISAGMFTTVRAEILLPDSVEIFLRHTPKDSSYITRLNRLAFDFLKSNPEISRSISRRAMEFSKAIQFTRGFARALNVTGSSYWVTGNYESALNFYHQSARESERIKDRVGLSESYHNMGEVYKKLGDYKKAITFLRTSLEWDTNNFEIALYNIGEAYYLLGKYDSASNYFDRSLSSAIKANNARTIAYAYTGLGKIKHYDKEYYQALAYFTKAERLWKDQGEIRSLVQTYQDFSETFKALGQPTRAMEYVNMAIVLSDELAAPDLQIYNYKQQSKLYADQGDMKNALLAMDKHCMIKDSIYHEKRLEEIARLQASFESGARDIENQQLKATHARQHAQIRTQKLTLIAMSAALIASAIMAWVLFRQRKRVAEVNDLLREKTIEIQDQKEEIEDLNKSLESKIEERTQRLMWQNQKLAEYAHANAHQLRAPVVSILGLLHLIERINLPEEDRILVQQLQVCGKNLDKITQTISRNLEEDLK